MARGDRKDRTRPDRGLRRPMKKKLKYGLGVLAVCYVLLVAGIGCVQRSLLYFPEHQAGAMLARENGLQRWEIQGEYAGYARVVDHPRKVWLFLHGNAGQAAGRGYVLPHLSPQESVYVLEYPGYGERAGKPTMESLNAAAVAAYRDLVARFGRANVQVLGESLGTGPASFLGSLADAPPRIVLLVPFNAIADVAQEVYPYLPIKLVMLDRWDNARALKSYAGRLEIYGAKLDEVIPVRHAKSLAAALPSSIYRELETGHGWSRAANLNLSDN